MPRHQSRADRETGNDSDELGKRVESCRLGNSDCPFESALQQLQREQHERIQSESELAVTIDDVRNKAEELFSKFQKYCEQFDELGRKVADYKHDLQAHIDRHRGIDLAIISIGAAIGGFVAKWWFDK